MDDPGLTDRSGVRLRMALPYLATTLRLTMAAWLIWNRLL
jgi:hypothetical protein